MKFEVDLRVGDRVIRITDDAATPAEFFQKMAFYDTIPPAGPNGEADLKFMYRTPQGYEYYTIESESAGEEFKFGQLKEAKGVIPKGSPFPKSWEPLQHGSERYEEEEQHRAPESPKSNPKKHEPKKSGQPSKSDPAGDINQHNDVDLNKRAKRIVAEGRVTKTKDDYKVAVNDKVTYEVWRAEDGRVKCNCERFRRASKEDASFRCEHIWSVKFFADSQSAAA